MWIVILHVDKQLNWAVMQNQRMDVNDPDEHYDANKYHTSFKRTSIYQYIYEAGNQQGVHEWSVDGLNEEDN